MYPIAVKNCSNDKFGTVFNVESFQVYSEPNPLSHLILHKWESCLSRIQGLGQYFPSVYTGFHFCTATSVVSDLSWFSEGDESSFDL